VTYWYSVRDGDLRALGLYQRHYSAKKSRAGYTITPIGNRARFVGNGEHIVLLTADCSSLFAWRHQSFRNDDQTGIECTVFRKEGAGLASDMIREAVALAWQRWPGARLFTFIDSREIKSTNPGYCFIKAGWRRLRKRTKRGLHILELLPEPYIHVAVSLAIVALGLWIGGRAL
jgi:hypothetical protein